MRKTKWGLLLCTTVLVGCPATIPFKGFMNVGDAFPNAAAVVPPSEYSEAMKMSLFAVGYEDVFRAAFVAANQAQFNVEREDRSAGLILATRHVKKPFVDGNRLSAPHLYFYAISVRETGSKRTEVSISAKLQVDVECGGFGKVKYCSRFASGSWATEFPNSAEEQARFMTLLRNNLLAAGLI